MSVVLHEVPSKQQSWQAPTFETPPEQRIGWIEEQIQEGEGFLSGQKSYVNLSQNMALFEAIFKDDTKSKLITNFLKYNIRKFVETLADVREIALFGSDAPQYKSYAEIANRVAKALYMEAQYPRQLRKALQYAAVMGIGYLWPKCKAADYGYGERQIIFEPLGMMDVLPVQVPSTNDVQDAYAVTIFEYMPIAEAHGRFPLFQSSLIPVGQMGHPSRLSAKRADWAEKVRYGSQQRNWGALYCEIRYTYIRDLRINRTGYELPMGDIDTSWFYKVPSVGQPIFGGLRGGQPFMRAAVEEDCRVYPNLRLIISAPGMTTPMYDGPAYDWHGRIPVVAYSVDDWPWEPLGLSLVETVAPIERTKRAHERKMDQVISTRLNPPMGYDRSVAGGPQIEQFDLFAQNVRAGMDGKPRDTFQSLLPDEVQVVETNFKFLELLARMEEQQLGINDLGSLVNMKLNLSADTFEKAVESIGPIAKGIAANVEAGNAKIAHMLKFMIPQWMSTKRIIEYVGPDNITPEIIDFDPDSLIPSHMADEYVQEMMPMVEGQIQPSYYDKLTRARSFASNLRLVSVPSTLLRITQMQEQLKYLQLFRGGFPISPHTVAKKLGIDNFGDIPGDTEFQKWVNWEKLKLALAAEAQQLGAELGIQAPEAGGKGPHAGGRPPSGKSAPKIKQKGKGEGNPRTTVTESK